MTDDPEDVISKSTSASFPGLSRSIEFPLSQYSDEELLELATELVERPPRFGEPHGRGWLMAFVSLEMNRRIFQRQVVGRSD